MPHATETTTGAIRQEEFNNPCWILARAKSNQKVSERPEQTDLVTLALLGSTSKWKTLSLFTHRCVQKDHFTTS